MKVKLDENLGRSVEQLLAAAGFDVATVVQQRLGGATDERVASVCNAESRVLITLDMDFANPLRFPPEGTPGIAVLRPRTANALTPITAVLHTLIQHTAL